MQNIKNFVNGVRSNWYIREPVYDANVRVKRSHEGIWLGAIAFSPIVIASGVAIAKTLGY